MPNPALVQQAKNSVTSNSVTATFGSGTTAGNLLVAYLANGDSGTDFSGATLSMPAGWVSVGVRHTASGNAYTGQVFYYPNNPGGITAVVGTSSISGHSFQLHLFEYSTMPASTAPDQTNTANGTGSTVAVSTPGNIGEAVELVIGAGGCQTPAGIMNKGPEATDFSNENSSALAQNITSGMEGYVTASAAIESIAPTFNSSFNWAGAIVTFTTTALVAGGLVNSPYVVR